MNKIINKHTLIFTGLAVVLAGILLAGVIILKKPEPSGRTGRMKVFLLPATIKTALTKISEQLGCNKGSQINACFWPLA